MGSFSPIRWLLFMVFCGGPAVVIFLIVRASKAKKPPE